MRSFLLFVALFVLPALYGVAARSTFIPETTVLRVADSYFPIDTLISQRHVDINPAASLSLVISSISVFAMIFTFTVLSVGLFFLAGALAITGLIFGIAGTRKRRMLLKGEYASFQKKRKLPLGQGRFVLGLVIGSIVTVVFGVLLVALISLGF